MESETSHCLLCGQKDSEFMISEEEEKLTMSRCSNPLRSECQVCAQADAVDKQIVAAKANLKSLIQRRRNIQSAQNRAHDPFILRLPAEIASTIFELSLSPFTYEDLFWPSENRDKWYRGRTNHCDSAIHPHQLASVCRGWRTFALSTPRLWTRIYIDLNQLSRNPQSYPKYVSTLLGRSHSLPLAIHLLGGFRFSLEIEDFMPIIDLLNAQSLRWEALILAVPTEVFPLLEGCGGPSRLLSAIKIDHLPESYPDHNLFRLAGGVPSPTHVMTRGARFESIHVNWEGVTHIQLEGLCCREFFFILSTALQLQLFGATFLPTDTDEGDYMTQKVIIHSQLEALQVTHEHEQQPGYLHVRDIFSKLVLPELQSLKLGGFGTIDGIAEFVSCSSCMIIELGLWRCMDTSDSVLTEIQRLPTLETLHIITPVMDIQGLLRRLAETRIFDKDQRTEDSFLPNLRSFFCRRNMENWNTWDWDLFVKIFAPPSSPLLRRPNHDKKPRPLQDVSFGVGMSPHSQRLPYIPQTELRRLKKITNSGVELHIDGPEIPISRNRPCFTETSRIYHQN